jgi:hypothetical protein
MVRLSGRHISGAHVFAVLDAVNNEFSCIPERNRVCGLVKEAGTPIHPTNEVTLAA